MSQAVAEYSASQEKPQAKSKFVQVAPQVVGVQIAIVNVYFVGTADHWVLIDAGVQLLSSKIVSAAQELFGPSAKPAAILLTHGHSDHCGGLDGLLKHWGDVPVYLHTLEKPYLTTESTYPPGDPTVGGGLLSRVLPLLPQNKIDFSAHLRELPVDGSVPELDGWRWIHTPGHTAGHVSYFRESDRTLIVGDAFVTRRQESLIATLLNTQHVHGPPKPMTPDWASAEASVKTLAALQPAAAGTGHGLPMSGEDLRSQLDDLAANFRERAVPPQGRYVGNPIHADEYGVQSVPAAPADPMPKIVAIVGAAAVAGIVLAFLAKSKAKSDQS